MFLAMLMSCTSKKKKPKRVKLMHINGSSNIKISLDYSVESKSSLMRGSRLFMGSAHVTNTTSAWWGKIEKTFNSQLTQVSVMISLTFFFNLIVVGICLLVLIWRSLHVTSYNANCGLRGFGSCFWRRLADRWIMKFNNWTWVGCPWNVA